LRGAVSRFCIMETTSVVSASYFDTTTFSTFGTRLLCHLLRTNFRWTLTCHTHTKILVYDSQQIRFPYYAPLLDCLASFFDRNVPSEFWAQQGPVNPQLDTQRASNCRDLSR
jgi:hypothetical protein